MTKLLTFLLLLSSVVYASEPYTISVSIPPQKFIVEKIAGDKALVEVLIPAGSDPHTYSPKIEDLKALGTSKIYFKIGVPFEHNVFAKLKDMYKNLIIIDSAAGIEFQEHKHEHGSDLHGHNEMDPHVWTSPANVLIVGKNICDALIQIDPVNKEYYVKNYKRFTEYVQNLDIKFKNLFNGSNNKFFMIYHPSLNYFSHDYNLVQLSVEKNGKAPKIKDMKQVIDIAKKQNIKILIIQPGQEAQVKMLESELKIKAVTVDVLAYDWQAMMGVLYDAFNRK